MKKLFTLFAAALCALAVSAKETLPNFTPSTMTFSGWTWIAIGSLGEGTAVDNGDGTADASGITYFDASEHEYVIFEYTAATCAKMKAIIQYTCNGVWGQYGAEFNTEEVETVLNSAGGIIAVKLDIDKSDKVYSIALQDPGTPGTLNLTDAYFATEEEYLAAKEEADNKEKVLVLDAEGGTHKLAAGDWGWDSKWLGATDVSAFNTAVIEVTSVKGHGKINFLKFEIDLPESADSYTVTSDISEITEIEQYAYQNVYKSSDEVELPDAETTIVVKKIYLTSKTKAEVDEEIATGINGVNAAPKAENNVRYNLLGVKNGNGIYIMNGKKYMK